MKKILKNIAKVLVAFIFLLVVVYLLGPKMKYENYNNTPEEGTYDLTVIQNMISDSNDPNLVREGNREEIIWADSRSKTEYSIVYLHGFSASHEEGAPIHRNIAKYLRANLFLSRFPKHGLKDSLAFEDLNPKELVEYAKDAIKIGKSLGDKLIVISCSTGSTLSAYLAANDPDIVAQIMFSPNFDLYSKTAKLLTKPWGLQIARFVSGSKYRNRTPPEKARPYWYGKYRLEGVVALQSLLEETMTDEIFQKVTQPTFVAYYYQDEAHQDFTISVERIREVENILGTAKDSMRFIAYPDGSAHVLNSPIFNDDWKKIESDVELFINDILDYDSEMTEEMLNEMQ